MSDRPLASIDLETTGADPATARIVTMAVVYDGTLPAGQGSHAVHFGFNPGFHMPDEVVAVHGITNEQAAKWPPFRDLSRDVLWALEGHDLVGFNLLNYDVPLLWEEFHRSGIAWDLTPVGIIDVSNIFRKREERTLTAAVRFYLGRDNAGAHGAEADAIATREILDAQLERYGDLPRDRASLVAYSRHDDRVDLAGRIVRNKTGVPCYAIGKAKGVPVLADRGFGMWMLKSEFSANTKQVLMDIFAGVIK